MDETSIYQDYPANYTFDEKVVKRVKAVTTGAERARISACFTATASGEKLPIYIKVPRKTDIPNYTPLNNASYSPSTQTEPESSISPPALPLNTQKNSTLIGLEFFLH
ncbi:unnamed protein product [Brachionus calyciflorus]|uniref:Uncharacterized protein n=1 Tax=Brachionus calyciflorus TaxID=104777 RepID=A0A814GCY9_9BILA|nr:unnamed protein product [Brachionus calyciflorus]